MGTRLGSGLSLAAALLVGCSTGGVPGGNGGDGGDHLGGDGGGPTTGVSWTQASEDALAAYCKQIATCAPLLMKVAFGDEATCNQRLDLVVSGAPPPGSSDTAERVESCAAAIAALSCHDLLAGPLPAVCHAPAGTLANGLACGDDSQCQSTHCLHPAGAGCGTCGAAPTVGSPCGNGIDCGTGLSCVSGSCAAWVELGGACDAQHPCNPATSGCMGDANGQMGSCVALLAAGAACDPMHVTTGACDALHGVLCNPLSKVCQELTYATAGQACGFLNGTLVVCAASANCKISGGPSGTCLAAAMDGAACDDTNGPKCEPPAKCTNGLCTLTKVASCQ